MHLHDTRPCAKCAVFSSIPTKTVIPGHLKRSLLSDRLSSAFLIQGSVPCTMHASNLHHAVSGGRQVGTGRLKAREQLQHSAAAVGPLHPQQALAAAAAAAAAGPGPSTPTTAAALAALHVAIALATAQPLVELGGRRRRVGQEACSAQPRRASQPHRSQRGGRPRA